MSLIDDTETDGISFIWTVQNFSYCPQKRYQELESPTFKLRWYEEDWWYLKLFPRGQSYENAIGLFLQRKTLSHSLKNVHFAISIRTVEGQFKKLKDDVHNFEPVDLRGYLCFLKLQELVKKGADAFLDDDTMTLRCRIWRVNDVNLQSGQCYARTIIGVKRSTYVYSHETNETEMYPVSSKEPFPTINITLLEPAEKKVQIEIKQADTNTPCFSTCQISVLDGRKSVYSERHEHWLKKSQIWKHIFNLGNASMEDTRLQIKCELAVSSGVEYSMIEKIDNEKLNFGPLGCFDQEKQPDFTDSCKDDLKRFYLEGKLCDMTIRTLTKDFQVHKAILCARSSVFCAMFERDMSENRTGVVEIEDVDAETISKMLLFVYTDVVDLKWDAATQLYFAADKYGITALRRTCSDFLKTNLDSSNVCDVLVLADMHHDLDLKSVVRDFILEHAPKVMGSVEWKKLMKDQLQLASEIMFIVCTRNLKI